MNLGQRETHWCAQCGQQRRFELLLIYKCWCLYWIFGVVTSRKYLKRCSACGSGWELDAKKVAPFVQPAIPFMQRFGLLSLVAAIALVIGVGAATR